MCDRGKFQSAKSGGPAGILALLLLSTLASAHETATPVPQPAGQIMIGDEPSDAMATNSISVSGKSCKSEQANLRMPIVEAGIPDETP